MGPKTSLYLNNLQEKLVGAGFRANLRLIQSNGGVSTVEGCARRAVSILMSGPAGGVIGGRSEGLLCGSRNLITVDIGGTSADISTIPDGRIKIMNPRDSYVSGHPILVPMIDLVTMAEKEMPVSLQFSRIADLVGDSTEDRAAGRLRFKYYRNQGIQPGTHSVSTVGPKGRR